MNLALYREFRPKTFDGVIGQDYIINTLKNQIKYNRLTHAYLFCGPRGTGKTSTAQIFARAVNCTNSADGNPCGLCAECVALSEPNTDIIEIDAASNNRVEEIRDLREKVAFPPMIGKYKVYIIDEVHMLTESAFNALLKTLEEPPKHVIFILATTEIHKLPATILSRCTRFDFKLLDINTLVKHLSNVFDKKGIKYDEKSLHLIAKAGEGSVRDMLSIADSVASYANYNITFPLTEKVIGLSNRDSIKQILLSLAKKDIGGLFSSIKTVLGEGKNIQVLCKETADCIKNLILIKVGVGDYSVLDILPGEFSQVSEIASMFDLEFLKRAFTKFAEIELNLKYSLNPENLFESACLSLLDEDSPQLQQNSTQTNKTATIVGNVNLSYNAQNQNTIQNPINSNANKTQSNAVQYAEVNEAPEFAEQKSLSEIEKIWGNVLIKVKENNMFALSNALTSVVKVEEINKKLILHTNDSSSYDLIDNQDKLDVLLKLVNLFDDSITKVELIYDKQNASKQDIKDSLKEIFKSNIKFKE